MARKLSIKPLDDKVRVLPRDEYDTLELVAYAFGGIGGGDWYRYESRPFAEWSSPHRAEHVEGPICINGAVAFADIRPIERTSGVVALDYNYVISVFENDDALDYLYERRRLKKDAFGEDRASWKDYCTVLNIVRGEE